MVEENVIAIGEIIIMVRKKKKEKKKKTTGMRKHGFI